MRASFIRFDAARAVALALLVPGTATAYAECSLRDAKPSNASDWATRAQETRRLEGWQGFRNSTRWRLTEGGLVLCGETIELPQKERYRFDLVPKAWERYGPLIRAAARRYRVPAELIIAVIVNESGLKPRSYQKYSGYQSDGRTPDRISVGLGATLISTARYMLGDDAVDRDWLADPSNSIRMVGLYLDRYYGITGFDPPKVAAAYNAGYLHHDGSEKNRWKLRNHPVGRSIYIDYFVAVTNEAMRMLANRDDRPKESFASIFHGPPEVTVAVEIPEGWSRRAGKLVLYRAPRDEMGVASSSIIDDKAGRSDNSTPKACRAEPASCSPSATAGPATSRSPAQAADSPDLSVR